MRLTKVLNNCIARTSVALFFLFSLSGFVAAQDATVNSDSVYSVVEKMPQFKGGDKALLNYIFEKSNYPSQAHRNKQEGKVIVQFIVDKLGKIQKAKVLRGVTPSLDKEALRVIKSCPPWIPGEQAGQKVAVYQTMPISFKWQPIPTDSANWQVNAKTLVIIDEVPMPKNFNADILNPAKLNSAVALRPYPKVEKKRLENKYGARAANGVFLITTNKYDMYYALADSSSCKQEATVPKFNGGNEQLLKYIADSIQYPFVPKQLKTEGKVFVRFRVDKNGRVSEARVLKSLDYFLDKEAIRVVNALPNWIAGTQCNAAIDIIVTMPVNFKIPQPATEKPAWKVTEKTIILLNGVRLPASFDLNCLNYTNLSTYKVLEPTTAELTKKLVSKYGKDAVNGVVLISTNKTK